jgi:LacI family fructose operon transcriptional repressor
MAMLFERIEKPDSPIRRVVLNGRFIARGSTARRD